MRIVLIALLAPMAGLAQVPAQALPRLVPDALDHDFGRISPSVTVSHSFKITNAGDATLNVFRVIPSCGCTSTVAGKSSLAPGETTEVAVTFNPAGLQGVVRKSVQVDSNDPVHPSQTLTFGAVVEVAVLPSSGEVRFRGLLPKDRRKTSVKFASSTGQPIHVTDVDLSPAPWLGVATREVGDDLWVDLELLARRLPAGKVSGTDTIGLHLLNPGASIVPLSVHWEKRVPVVCDPQRVAWAEPSGQEHAASLMLEHRENKPFRILSARTSNPLVQVVDLAPKAASRHPVRLTLSAAAKAGTYDEEAFLTLDTPGHPELEIRVSASLR